MHRRGGRGGLGRGPHLHRDRRAGKACNHLFPRAGATCSRCSSWLSCPAGSSEEGASRGGARAIPPHPYSRAGTSHAYIRIAHRNPPYSRVYAPAGTRASLSPPHPARPLLVRASRTRSRKVILACGPSRTCPLGSPHGAPPRATTAVSVSTGASIYIVSVPPVTRAHFFCHSLARLQASTIPCSLLLPIHSLTLTIDPGRTSERSVLHASHPQSSQPDPDPSRRRRNLQRTEPVHLRAAAHPCRCAHSRASPQPYVRGASYSWPGLAQSDGPP